MNTPSESTLVGNSPYLPLSGNVTGEIVSLAGQSFYCIENIAALPPFFISLVSPSDHWMFISSTGGLTAGRINADSALFPYETVDKITENFERVGSKTILRITKDQHTYLWEPFSTRFQGLSNIQRNLYKNLLGTQLIFEEVNHDLNLTYRYAWRTSDQFGFVKSSTLENHSEKEISAQVLDGVQYLLSYGIANQTQSVFSNLLDAYKRSELETQTGIGMFTLSSTLSDMPEANESLKATTAWYFGSEAKSYLLSSKQLDRFRRGEAIQSEQDLRGTRGAYFVESSLHLPAKQHKQWHFVLEVNQEITSVITLKDALLKKPETLWQKVEADIKQGDRTLKKLVASSDGLQCTGDPLANTHHFANTLFNIMRGGIPDDNYQVHKTDFLAFLDIHNKRVKKSCSKTLSSLPESLSINELIKIGKDSGSVDFLRLCYEYLPLTFSRRHGDPSRPWNQFSINLKNPDGSRKLDFQGNWRDIFQNWEPLAFSFPEFIEGMIHKFLNATTADGYNPYRLTFSGFEWEIPNPEDPWGNIGYWGDHQIIYLQKLLELSEQFHPGTLANMLEDSIFVHANVPYRIKPFQQILKDWHNTIDFDRPLNTQIEEKVAQLGTDGKLLLSEDDRINHFTMTEKLLNLLLAKVVNFIPDGGIWMNTQRPEWNDANNALAGKGISVVTTAYLYRFLGSLRDLVQQSNQANFTCSEPLVTLFHNLSKNLTAFQSNIESGFNNADRFAFMTAAGTAGDLYRSAVYNGELTTHQKEISSAELLEFLNLLTKYLEKTLYNNQRDDHLFHAYNVLKLSGSSASVEHLTLMLEGQVAMLSAGLLTPDETLRVLTALRSSELYRADQHSYTLYPDRHLAGFLEKNVIPADAAKLDLFSKLIQNKDHRLVLKDIHGGYHFSGALHNERDLNQILDQLAEEEAYQTLVAEERELVLDCFEEVFHHSAFTGRSGTFFGYEGLGSIYWHMVTKLLLAVQENYWWLDEEQSQTKLSTALNDFYYDIRNGIGFNKTPAVYGSFPTDPYSHTPKGAGAKQPGMTGQVKEELMTRWRELGVNIHNGAIEFQPSQLQEKEFLPDKTQFVYVNLQGETHTIDLPADSLCFTLCQVPVIYYRSTETKTILHYQDGTTQEQPGHQLSQKNSQIIFQRTGEIIKIEFFFVP